MKPPNVFGIILQNILSLQLDDIAPSRCGVLAAEVMLDGIGEYISLAFALLLGVLLRAHDEGLGAVEAVDSVEHIVKRLQLVVLLGLDVKQIVQIDFFFATSSFGTQSSPLSSAHVR